MRTKPVKVEHIGGPKISYFHSGIICSLRKGDIEVIPVEIYRQHKDQLALIKPERWNIYPSRYDHVIQAIAEYHPAKVMEIGVLNGITARRMIMEMLTYMDKPSYIGFDLFELSPEDEGSKSGVESHWMVKWKLSKFEGAKVRLIKGDTNETLPAYKGPKVDLIFIDGGHSLETIASDFHWSSQWLKPGGVILMDDYYPEIESTGCKQLIDSLPDPWKWELLEPPDSPRGEFIIHMVKVWKNEG